MECQHYAHPTLTGTGRPGNPGATPEPAGRLDRGAGEPGDRPDPGSDRNTLVAILSSRDDISEADVNPIIDQIESARTSVLRRAERLQHEAQRRLEEVKRQAQHQAEETRKAAATAAWWLFATALVSAATSAVAGAIAVG